MQLSKNFTFNELTNTSHTSLLEKNRLEAKNKADELNFKYEEEVTKRHQADMISDNWISKSIRPITLIFILIMYSFVIYCQWFQV